MGSKGDSLLQRIGLNGSSIGTKSIPRTIASYGLDGTAGGQDGIISQWEKGLYSDNAVLKIWKTATEHLERKVCIESHPFGEGLTYEDD